MLIVYIPLPLLHLHSIYIKNVNTCSELHVPMKQCLIYKTRVSTQNTTTRNEQGLRKHKFQVKILLKTSGEYARYLRDFIYKRGKLDEGLFTNQIFTNVQTILLVRGPNLVYHRLKINLITDDKDLVQIISNQGHGKVTWKHNESFLKSSRKFPINLFIGGWNVSSNELTIITNSEPLIQMGTDLTKKMGLWVMAFHSNSKREVKNSTCWAPGRSDFGVQPCYEPPSGL